MAGLDEEAIEVFMNITGVTEAEAIQNLEDHCGDLTEAVNAYFSEWDGGISQEGSFAAPSCVGERKNPRPVESLLSFARDIKPISFLDPYFTGTKFDSDTDIASRSPFVSHPREVREVPIEFKDKIGSGSALITQTGPSAPPTVDVRDCSNDIEEKMLRIAIEDSMQDSAMSNQHLDLRDPTPLSGKFHVEDAELAHAVSLSLQSAEALKKLKRKAEVSELEGRKPVRPDEMWESLSSNGSTNPCKAGSSSIQDKAEYAEELSLGERKRRCVSSFPADTTEDVQEIERQLAAKEASLPQEPTAGDENAVTLLVRMPDGSRSSRRFYMSDKLQFLFGFIDAGGEVKPGSYRLVRSYPRRTFSNGESSSTLKELGLTSKREALFMELI